MKNIPVGIENFKKIIDDDFYYVDKSELINDILPEQCVLFTRPRRFGKTLNMSMLYYFFSNKEKENAYLFDGLNISFHKNAMKHQNQYPVIFLTLKDLIENTIEAQMDKYASLIADVIKKNNELLESEFVDKTDKKILKTLKNRKGSLVDLKESLYRISQCMHQHYHKRVIILIDEYDVPLQSAYKNGYYNEMVNFLRSVFSSALKTNDALEKGLLTGCLRISKESIFTDLNNFKVYSIMDHKTSEYYGFVPEEVNQLLKYYHLENHMNEVKYWYDGYQFGNTEIYNPWSTLMYVDRKMSDPTSQAISFWANTSSNELVVNYIKNADDVMYDEFQMLMQGQSLKKYLKLDLTYKEMDNQDNVYSFLLLTGYLRVINQIDLNTYEFIIPNKEVYEIYKNSFLDYFNMYTKERKHQLITALLEKKGEEAQEILNDILFKDISYYDNSEAFYHGFLIGLMQEYGVSSNKESGEGRLDIFIKPRRADRKVIVIECKHSQKESKIVKDSEIGAKQILEKRYLEGIKVHEQREAVGYGIAFYKKRCQVTLAE